MQTQHTPGILQRKRNRPKNESSRASKGCPQEGAASTGAAQQSHCPALGTTRTLEEGHRASSSDTAAHHLFAFSRLCVTQRSPSAAESP